MYVRKNLWRTLISPYICKFILESDHISVASAENLLKQRGIWKNTARFIPANARFINVWNATLNTSVFMIYRFTWDDTTGIFHSAARTAPRGSGRRGTWTTTNGSTPGINPSSVKAAARPSRPPRPCASTLRRLQSAGNMRRTCRDLTANLNHLTKQRMNSIWLTVLFWTLLTYDWRLRRAMIAITNLLFTLPSRTSWKEMTRREQD